MLGEFICDKAIMIQFFEVSQRRVCVRLEKGLLRHRGILIRLSWEAIVNSGHVLSDRFNIKS